MSTRQLTIGDVSRRTGVPVKTLRFYSDEGLLPPSDRTDSGYRLYSENDLVRLDLIRTLRDAGLDLATIRSVLEREMTLGDALRLRLRALESHIVSLQQAAAAIRAALRSEPDEDDIRRLCAVTRLSNEERKHMIEGFLQEVVEGIPIDKEWMQTMIDVSTPRLPDEPTRQQLDAWIEMSEIVTDRGLIAQLRAHAASFWTPGLDFAAAQQANADAVAAAKAALDRGLAPDSPEAGEIVERYVVASAAAAGCAPDAAFRAQIISRYRSYDPRLQRYWELMAILKEDPTSPGPTPDWQWLVDASKAHLER